MPPRVALFAVLLAGCGGALNRDNINLADAATPVPADATVQESGARDTGRVDTGRDSASPVDTMGDASLSPEPWAWSPSWPSIGSRV